ncbi:TadE/TadG family type IV pilus assembly protein [Phenylobacterium sp.]|jgi:Flp pilus assembly protein TadG|uniref:TadE/TadG family type IV pilus assembly protein n=1 Tax=Phenylobacterium sp. TaxID=1871053 RepID=UPI002E34BBF7|nr:TadE/TadG family type IV pilus assembly protein [Phenylobacterium sp.]HEX4710276.1 TadE/TadG family type IV pilus assembly protein [Phenylobacterium sp.]
MTASRKMAGMARDDRGATAVEFALVLPAFILMILGGMATATLGFAASSLHFAVEDAARCAAVKTTVCTNAAATQTYAAARYQGPAISPVFTATTAGCGHTVSATGVFSVNVIPQLLNVPLSATACYP